MAVKAINKRTGAAVTADEAVIRRLGPEWKLAIEKKPATGAKPRPRRSKSDSK